MQSLKKKIINLPFLLLLSYVVFLITKQQPSIPDSIITIALASLYGVSLYLEILEQPDYSKQINAFEEKLEKEIKLLRNDMNVVNMSIKSPNTERRISF